MAASRLGSRRPSLATDYGSSNELELGDTVEVPGGNRGTVKYIGAVQGKNGVFAGVELNRDSAAFGKNNGEVEGVQYFTCAVPGAGIFLPHFRAVKIETPRTPSSLKSPPPDFSRSVRSPPTTPSISKFSQSVGPGARHPFSQTVGPSARAPTPQAKPKSRPSLPRPGSPAKGPAATPGRPTVAGLRIPSSPAVSRAPTKPATPIPARTQSRAQSRLGDSRADAPTTPTSVARPGAGGRTISSSLGGAARADEVRRLQGLLEERDRQLTEQAASISEMEVALTELQAMVAENTNNNQELSGRNIHEQEETLAELEQLRSTLAEKNDRIATLTAEFESHRRDFRETISALESASSETERVYEAKLRETMQQVEELRASNEDLMDREGEVTGEKADMDMVAEQLAQLDNLVQELEEGLEGSRRNEAEARRRVEELEGEVERERLALEQEREKHQESTRSRGAENHAAADAISARLEQEKLELEEELQRRDEELRDLGATFRQLELNAKDHDTRSSEKGEELTTLKSTLRELEQRSSTLEMENDRLKDELGAAKDRNAELIASTRSKSQSPTRTRTPLSNRATTGALRPFAHDSPHALSSILNSRHVRGSTDTTDAVEDDKDDLWCDWCEMAGHDVLSCTTTTTTKISPKPVPSRYGDVDGATGSADNDFLSSKNLPHIQSEQLQSNIKKEDTPSVEYDPNHEGPVAGKKSGKIDPDKHCIFCSLDGHESLDCPYEEEL